MRNFDTPFEMETVRANELVDTAEHESRSSELARPIFVYSRRAQLALSGIETAGFEIELWG